MATSHASDAASSPAPEESLTETAQVDTVRTRARKRLEDRRGLWTHAVLYVIVNALLVGIWAIGGGGYFWPGWVLAIWGVALIMHSWDFFWRWIRPITEADVDAEVAREQRHR